MLRIRSTTSYFHTRLQLPHHVLHAIVCVGVYLSEDVVVLRDIRDGESEIGRNAFHAFDLGLDGRKNQRR